MNILVAGAEGYVGRIVTGALSKRHVLRGVGLEAGQHPNFIQMDLADEAAVRRLPDFFQPEAVIVASGLKDIGRCERQPEDARKANVAVPRNLARTFGGRARIIYISTDYVFAGDSGGYGEDDPTLPRTLYGRSKLEGEQAGLQEAPEDFLVLRIAALYNLSAPFLRFVRSSLMAGKNIDCYSDTFFSPTYAGDFIRGLEKLLIVPQPGRSIFHVCGERTSRYGFAREIARVFALDHDLIRESSGRDNPLFLFPDLSMNGDVTRRELSLTAMSILDSLHELKEGEHADL